MKNLIKLIPYFKHYKTTLAFVRFETKQQQQLQLQLLLQQQQQQQQILGTVS